MKVDLIDPSYPSMESLSIFAAVLVVVSWWVSRDLKTRTSHTPAAS